MRTHGPHLYLSNIVIITDGALARGEYYHSHGDVRSLGTVVQQHISFFKARATTNASISSVSSGQHGKLEEAQAQASLCAVRPVARRSRHSSV